METHVKVLGLLHVALGALGVCCALFLMVVFGGTTGMIGASGQATTAVNLGIIEMAFVSFIVVLSLPAVIIGVGLIKRQAWARVAGIVLCVLDLMVVPFGTLVGAYGLWVLFSSETERIFASPAATTAG